MTGDVERCKIKVENGTCWRRNTTDKESQAGLGSGDLPPFQASGAISLSTPQLLQVGYKKTSVTFLSLSTGTRMPCNLVGQLGDVGQPNHSSLGTCVTSRRPPTALTSMMRLNDLAKLTFRGRSSSPMGLDNCLSMRKHGEMTKERDP